MKGVYVIAEAGVNHNGFLDLAKQLVEAAKRRLAERYFSAFEGFVGGMFREPSYARSNYWLNVLLLDEGQLAGGAQVLQVLHNAGYLCRPVWSPIHLLGMYAKCPRMDLAGMENLARRIICLPSGVARNPINLTTL